MTCPFFRAAFCAGEFAARVLACFGIALLVSGRANACSCVSEGEPSPCRYFAQADAVFLGRVLSVAGIEERLRQQVLEAHDLADLEPSQWAYMVPRRILFSIESALKFGPELQVQILSPVFPNTCGSALLGQPYVVYARKKDSTFSTHLCFGTRLLSEASEDLQYLQRLQCSEVIREICGPVTTAESEPLPGAIILVEGNEFSRTIRPDAGGRFLVSGLRDGEYRLTLSVGDSEDWRVARIHGDRDCARVSFYVER